MLEASDSVQGVVPPPPQADLAAAAALRGRIRRERQRWRFRLREIAEKAGFHSQAINDFFRNPHAVLPTSEWGKRVEAGLDALVREQTRRVLAEVDPEFAEWDAARRPREAAERAAARAKARAEARALAEQDE